MTSPALPDQGVAGRPGVLRPLLYLLGVAVPTATITAVTLATPGRIIRLTQTQYDTSKAFINHTWWGLALLLAVPVLLVARAHPRLATVAVLIAAVPQFVVAHVYIVRVDEAGWGDGLEVFAYVESAVMTCVFVVTAMLGAAMRRRRQFRRGGSSPASRPNSGS